MLRARCLSCVVELQIHLSPDFAPPTHFVLRPAGEAGHDRQSPPPASFCAEREGVRHGVGTSGIADAEGEPTMGELELQFDPVALVAPVTDRVGNQLARHEQSVMHPLPFDPAVAECVPQ